MRKDNVSKVILGVQNSLGIIMYEFRAVQSKTEGMTASVREFFEHPSYVQRMAEHYFALKIPINSNTTTSYSPDKQPMDTGWPVQAK